jgi:flagellar hook-basal body complex protein FliE
MLPPLLGPTAVEPLLGRSLGLPAASTPATTSFRELLERSLGDVAALQTESQTAVQDSLIGEDLSMVETFTALREADLALKLMVQIRNKLVDAYQELQNLRF